VALLQGSIGGGMMHARAVSGLLWFVDALRIGSKSVRI
jgi:hypothetical protein